jgi:hypothetical protein
MFIFSFFEQSGHLGPIKIDQKIMKIIEKEK